MTTLSTKTLREQLMEDLRLARAGDERMTNATLRARAAATRAIIATIQVEISAANLGRHFDPIEIGACEDEQQPRARAA